MKKLINDLRLVLDKLEKNSDNIKKSDEYLQVLSDSLTNSYIDLKRYLNSINYV